MKTDEGRVAGRVASVGARFGFVQDAAGEDYYFTTDRLPPGLRLWPGDAVTFTALRRTAKTTRAVGGRPLATRIRRAAADGDAAGRGL